MTTAAILVHRFTVHTHDTNLKPNTNVGSTGPLNAAEKEANGW